MNDRIRELRKALKLTLEEFGARIGMNKSSVSKIETGKNGTTEQTIKSICREFHVNEVWLRTGDGEMFRQDYESSLEMLIKEYNLTDLESSIMSKFLLLDEKSQIAVKGYVDALVDKLSSEAVGNPQNKNTNPSRHT